ncbi:hypothetical protein PPACK8108_LOCUS5669 [Phakopsora pachyrhizi]|uniref:Uncharacterized protein n=1 Tax=Phakopsora pachyrhizi TaxID=170000 RepID=A0AAV0AQR0_PHAPC|nr:hypothetical protein PPACK8108_LOCUS5669 [Phakopsora pachyrhizi]
MNDYGQHLSQRARDWQDLILWRQCIEVDCGWVKALDQQFDPRLDGSDHSLLNPWVDVGLVLLVYFGLGVGLGLVVGESGSLRDTVLDNHSKGPEALHHFLKDDWDMPKVGISQDLTWQHLEKKLTKSFRLEIPDFCSSNLNQSEKETHSPTPKPNPHPRAPSANGALVGSAISSSFLINGKKPSTPDQQLAHSFSVPPSPSPDCVDMRTHGKVLASDLGLPMGMVHTCCLTSSNNVSLTWQQAIMRSPPKLHNSFPLHSSSTDSQLELLEELKPCKKKHTKPEAHSVFKSVAGFQCDDRHRRRNSKSFTGYLSSQIPIIAGKRSINLKNSGFGEDVGAIKPSSLSNASEDKSTVLGKFSSSALPLGSSQSGNLVQANQLD